MITLYKTTDELNKILDELLLNPENECVEFKQAENNFDINNLGKYFSALGNEANLKNKYLIIQQIIWDLLKYMNLQEIIIE